MWYTDELGPGQINMNLALATIKPWNVENFRLLKERDKKVNWYLIQNEDELDLWKIQAFNPRYIFFPHWSWIIPKEIWSKYECVVFHMTDLPYGRGGTPLQNLILRGYKTTKISAIRVNGGIDEGDIYLKRSLNLSGSAEQIYRRASKTIFTKMIPYIIKNNPQPRKQLGKAIGFNRRESSESRLPENLDLNKTYDFIRMLDAEDYPRAFLETEKLRFEFKKARLVKNKLLSEVEIYEK